MPKLFKMAPHLDDVDGVARSMLRYVEMTEQSCKSLNCLVLAPKSHLFWPKKSDDRTVCHITWFWQFCSHYVNYIQLLLYYKFLLRSVLLFQARYFFCFIWKVKGLELVIFQKIYLLISKIVDSRLVFTYLKLW